MQTRPVDAVRDVRFQITRTQSSLTPVLSSSSAQTDRSVDVYTPFMDLHEAPVQLLIRNARVLIISIGLALGLGTISWSMWHGVDLPELSASNLSDKDKSKLLDRYNTYTGAVFSVVIMPFQQIVAQMIPVFFLCFATSTILSENKSSLQKWALMGATAAASFVVGQGINAVNVQLNSPRTEFIIGQNDLVSSDTTSFSNVITNATNSASVAGIPSTDTILRNAIRSSAANSVSTCLGLGDWTDTFDAPEGSIRYGFSLSSWMEYLLPTSVTCEKSAKFSMNDTFTPESADSVMSEWKLDETATLFSYGLASLIDHFSREFTAPHDVNSMLDSSDAVHQLTSMQDAIQNLCETYATTYDSSGTAANWTDISVSEMTVEFSSFNLSPQIQFDAATFNLPVTLGAMQSWIRGNNFYKRSTSGADSYIDFLSGNLGNEHAFIMASPTRLDDQVRMLRLCAKDENDTADDIAASSLCLFPLNSSILIYSFAQHITMDEWKLFQATEDGNLEFTEPDTRNTNFRMKNHRKIYSVTVGKLSWQSSDLAQVYDAKCEANSPCRGLHFPLTNVNKHVVISEWHIPNIPNTLTDFFGSWLVLVSSKTELIDPCWSIGSRFHIDLIYPPNYPAAPDSLEWNLTGLDCTSIGSDFINDVIQRHIYSKDPVQPA